MPGPIYSDVDRLKSTMLNATWNEIARGTYSGDVSITATSLGTAQAVVSVSAPANGADTLRLECECAAGVSSGGMHFVLLEDGVSLGQVAHVTGTAPVFVAPRRLAASGTRAYTLAAFVDSGTGTVKGPGSLTVMAKR
jgi:hypothetical protein